MTEKGLLELFVVLDQVWGDMDPSREAGYRLVLEDHEDDDVAAAVRQLMQEDRTWLPKAPTVAARAAKVARGRRTRERLAALVERVARRELGEGDRVAP